MNVVHLKDNVCPLPTSVSTADFQIALLKFYRNSKFLFADSGTISQTGLGSTLMSESKSYLPFSISTKQLLFSYSNFLMIYNVLKRTHELEFMFVERTMNNKKSDE